MLADIKGPSMRQRQHGSSAQKSTSMMWRLNRLSGGSTDAIPHIFSRLISGKPSINYSYQQIMHHSVLRQGFKDRCFSPQWIFSPFLGGNISIFFVRRVKIFKASWCLCCLTEDCPSFPVMSPELLVSCSRKCWIHQSSGWPTQTTNTSFFSSFPSCVTWIITEIGHNRGICKNDTEDLWV